MNEKISEKVTADVFRMPEGLENNVREILEKINESIDKISLPSDIRKMLRTMLNSAATKKNEAITAFQTSIEEWFDNTMDRVTGWYKRKAQLIILVLAVIATGVLNMDSLAITKSLSQDDALRASVVAAAEERVLKSEPEGGEPILDHEKIQTEIESLGLPIGWPSDPEKLPNDFSGWLLKICGLILTSLLVALGAPFWFDLLNKIVNIRSSGNQPKKGGQTKISSELKIS